jgi:hypothetical protein
MPEDDVWCTHLSQRNLMNYFPLTTEQQEWKERTAEIAERYIGPRAADYDRKAQFPQESLNALRDAGLWAMMNLCTVCEWGLSGIDAVGELASAHFQCHGPGF